LLVKSVWTGSERERAGAVETIGRVGEQGHGLRDRIHLEDGPIEVGDEDVAVLELRCCRGRDAPEDHEREDETRHGVCSFFHITAGRGPNS
jgi:hypothetical protein